MTDYHTIKSAVIVKPVGKDIFCEMATTVCLDDEGGGCFIKVSQTRVDPGEIAIDPGEWPTLRAAIDEMVQIAADVDGEAE